MSEYIPIAITAIVVLVVTIGGNALVKLFKGKQSTPKV